jgi:hypothetical protein
LLQDENFAARDDGCRRHENNLMKKNLLRLLVLPALTLLAAAAAAQGANQAPKNPTPAPVLAGAELFPMPAIPDDDPASAPAPSSSVWSHGAALFPMLAIPDDDPASAPAPSSSVSSHGAELFPMPAIPDDDPASAPAPLTQAESEMQARIQNAIGKDPTLTGGNVNVSMSAGGIELTGTVASVRARLAASRLAKSYAAGRKVLDKITVAANTPETPAEPSPAKADSPGTAHQRP